MSKKIRILIVDDVPESRDSVGKLLRFEPDMEVIGVAGEGQEAIQKAAQLNPDIILMDINMPTMDGITAAGIISQQTPNAAVIMMSVQNEADYLRRSMQAGAREFLVKPFSLDDLVRSIRSVNENRRFVTPAQSTAQLQPASSPSGERGQIICAFSPKGGTGCSTVVANLAVATKLATKKRVALCDGDLVFGDQAVLLNLPVNKTITDLSSNIRQLDEDLLSDVMVTHSSGVKVLLAPPTPQQAETITAEHMRLILQTMVNAYDYVFVDLRASFDDVTLAAMDLADLVFLVIRGELTSLKNARLYLEVADLLGYSGDKVRLVLNQANAAASIPADAIADNLRRPVDAQLVDDPRTVAKSVNDGVPYVITAPDSRLARDIQTLVQFIEPEQRPETVEASASESKGTGFLRFFPISRQRIV